jgi:pheganomycin biosynthesis PGM1-like protein
MGPATDTFETTTNVVGGAPSPLTVEGAGGPVALDPAALATSFTALQARLATLWPDISRGDLANQVQVPDTVVVVPAMTWSREQRSSFQQAYEERMLFMLFLLRQPAKRLIYVTSQPVHASIVDYYLHLLPGITISHARKRLFMVSPTDASPRSLTQKLLDRPRLLAHIRSLIPDLNRAHLVPYTTTDAERELAVRLGIPMYGADPSHSAFGTKTGGRRVFAAANVQYPLGAEDLWSATDLVAAIERMRHQRADLGRVVVKLNDGVSGRGNALVDLSGLPAPGHPEAPDKVLERLRAMHLEADYLSYGSFMDRLAGGGGIVEEWLEGDEVASPSAQLRISPLGEVLLDATHDQILGGPSGQSYLGASFPASPAYAPLVAREATRIGEVLAGMGVVGRFAVDFVVVRQPGGPWRAWAIEINLRKGGTTHPLLTLQFLTGGKYDPDAGVFKTPRGERRCYVATDHLESAAYRAFTPEELFDIVSEHGVHFDHATQAGVVLHFLGGVGEQGRLGLTAIADAPAAAQALYDRTVEIIEAKAAGCPAQ